jgi:nucleotide-binding universal stress UspA family protein
MIGEHEAMEELKETVEQRDVDLLLMGSHSGSALRHLLVGSALDFMLRESEIPIFICR